MSPSGPLGDSKTTHHSEGEALQVLLVEDNPGDARLFEEYLSESPVEAKVRHEETLRACLKALGEEDPDVLALDLGLPDSEGAETVKAAAAAAPKVPIVVLTGDGNLQAALEAQQAGAAEYLQKEELTPALAGRTLRWALRQSRMQEKLRQREAWIRSITEGLSAGVFRTGPTGRIEYANQALAEMLGAEAEEELVGLDLTTFYADPTDRGQMLVEEGADGVEVRFTKNDGSVFAGLLSAKAVCDEEGRPVYYDGVITDITEQKETQRELKRSEELTRSVLDALAANVSVLGGDGTIIDVNEQWERFGAENEGDPEKIGVGTNYLEVCSRSGEDQTSLVPPVEERLRAVIDGERDFFEHEYPCHSPEEKRWFLLRATPLEIEEGGAVVAHIDVTERVQAVRRQRILSEAVEQAKESVLITEAEPLDKPGPRVEYVNAAFEEMTGYPEEEMVGKTPRVLQGPDTDRDVLDSLRAALEAGEEWQGETINYRKDGTPYRVQWNVSPVVGEEGEIEHWVSVQRDVTEERKREERLRLLAEAFEQVGDKVMITGTDGQIEYVNDAFEDVTGYSRDELLGKTPAIVHSGKQGEAFYEELWETLQSGETFRSELVNERKGGGQYVEEEVIAPVTDEEGEVTHFVSTGRDITERKEAEEELQSTKNFYEQILGQAPIDLAVFSREAEFEYLNPQSIGDLEMREWLIGRTNEDYCRKRGIDLKLGRRRDRAIRKAAEEKEVKQFEETMETGESSRHFLRMHSPVTDLDGEVTHVVAFGVDITERKRQQKRLAKTVERVTDAIVEVDSEWRFTLVNEQAETLYDMSENDLLGEDFWEVFEEALGTRLEEEYRQVMQTREPTRFEEHYSGLDGWFDIQVYPNDDGGLAFYFTEITARKEREQALREAKDEAERMNRLKSAFLANMSHEIRTPLTSILGFTEAIGDEVGSASEASEIDLPTLAQFLGLIEKSGNRLMDTLTGVLNLSKLEAGEMNFSLEPVDVTREAKEAADQVDLEAEKAGIELEVDTGSGPIWARADEGGLRIVLRNLLSNAIKYTEDGGQVWVRTRAEEDLVVLEVEDTGIGMDSEEVQGLFEAFKQESEGIGREYEGSGLGLAVTQKVLGQMGGSIEVETEKGKGSRFTVRLPRSEHSGEA